MTSDEVILRRQRSTDENGCETMEPPPPPRLRGQSTYLALLSSLATDLDIMLNDLRSSPSSRLLSPASRSPNSSSPATVGGGGGSGSGSLASSELTASSAFLRSNQSVQIIPSQSVSTATTVVTRVASPVPEHRYHHYCYQQQYSTHNLQQQSHRLNQDFYYHRFHNSNHHRSNGLRSGNAHATAAQLSSSSQNTSRGAFQSIVTTIATASTTAGSQQHQTSAAVTATSPTLLGSTNRTASAAHNERDAFW